MLLEKKLQTCTSPTYSHKQDYPNPSSAIEILNSPPKFWETLMQHLKIKLDISTTFHSQTDRSTEITNKTIIQSLRDWVSAKQDNWVHYLLLVTYAINISTNDTITMSPFYLKYSHQPKFLPDSDIK